VALVVCSFLPAAALRFVTSTPRHVLESVTAPFTDQLGVIADWLRPPPPPEQEVVMAEELAILRAQNEQLQHQVNELMQLLVESQAVQDFVRQQQLDGFEWRTVSVARGAFDPARPTLTLSRGDTDRVQVGQVVIVRGAQLVGRISDTGPVTATVNTILQPKTVLEVVIRAPQPSDRDTRVRATVERDRKALVFRTAVGKQAGVQVGDLAQLADDDWPDAARGFVLGRVTQVLDDPEHPTLRDRLTIEPTVDLRRLNYVTVLVDR